MKAGRVGDTDEAGPDDSGSVDHWRGNGGRLEVGCRREMSPQDDTAATTFVDEEEIVVTAIKNFRLLSHAAKTASESHNSSPRYDRDTPEGVTSCSSKSCTAASECGGTLSAEETATATGGNKGGENRSLPSRRCGQGGENATRQSSSVGHAHGHEELGEGQNAAAATVLGSNGFYEGRDWLLKVNSPYNT